VTKIKVDLIMSVIGSFILLMISTPFITYDGYQYISSAKAILENSMALNYFWVREPGYPTIISFFILFNNLTFLFIFQSLLYFYSSLRLIRVYGQCHNVSRSNSLIFYLAFFAVTLWIGGYNFGVLQQSLMITIVNLIVTELLKIDYQFKSHITYRWQNQVKLVLLGIGSTLFADALRNFFLVLILLFFLKNYTRKDKTLINKKHDLFFVAINVVIIFAISITWSNFKSANSKSMYNNWNTDANYSVSFKDYVKEISVYPKNGIDLFFTSWGSLSNLTENRGWIGIVKQEVSRSDQYQNEWFGFGPLSNKTFSECLQNSNEEIISVQRNYGQEILSSTLCKATNIYLPFQVNEVVYLTWIVLLLFYFRNILLIRNSSFALFNYVPFIYISQYALLGGALDRYGVPVYLLIALIGSNEIIDILKKRFRLFKS
jgi:hypothetical protein